MYCAYDHEYLIIGLADVSHLILGNDLKQKWYNCYIFKLCNTGDILTNT